MDRSLRLSQALTKYLGSVITDEGSKPEILSRIAQTTAALTRLKPVWNDRSISLSSKIVLCAPLSHPSSYMLVTHGPSQQNCRKQYKSGNEVLPQDTTHLIQRPCYQRGSPCQDPAGNRTTRRPPDDRKETQTAVVWTCLPFIRSGQNHLARYIERGKKTRQTEEVVGGQPREWAGLEFANSRRAVENREKLRKLVVKSSVVPQRPSRLKDR